MGRVTITGSGKYRYKKHPHATIPDKSPSQMKAIIPPSLQKKQLYQNVLITLSDGTTHVFTGKAFMFKENENRRIKEIAFTRPKELPEGYTFEDVEEG